MKKITFFIFLGICFLIFPGCYEETNPLDGLVDIEGDVAQVSSVVPSVNEADAGSSINLTIKCHALNTDIKEFNIYQRIGTSGAFTLTKTELFVPNYVEAERLHVVTIPFLVPNEKGKVFGIQVEAVTTNGLISSRRSMAPATVKIK